MQYKNRGPPNNVSFPGQRALRNGPSNQSLRGKFQIIHSYPRIFCRAFLRVTYTGSIL